MATRKTTEQFISEAKIIHGDKFDYSKVEYLGAFKKVKIICPIHGEFLQRARGHLNKLGCEKCGILVRAKKRTFTTSIFIEKSKKIHGDKYDYKLVDYKGDEKKVIIICPTHGSFLQTPHGHLNKKGCNRCGVNSTIEIRRTPKIDFIKKAQLIHGDKYDYSKVEYYGSFKKVTIICPIHGEFSQDPSNHLSGKSCAKCGRERTNKATKINSIGYKDSLWHKASLNSNHFDSYKIYLVKFSNEDETFYKIGKTFNITKKRLSTSSVLYKKEIIKEIKNDDYKTICELERELHEKNKHLKYKPKIKFNGMHECFQFTNEIIFEENPISIIT